MTDKKKQSISENPKPKYQPPKMILFGGTNEGSGSCDTGSSDSLCKGGGSAVSTCNYGNSTGACKDGNSATACSTGDSN